MSLYARSSKQPTDFFSYNLSHCTDNNLSHCSTDKVFTNKLDSRCICNFRWISRIRQAIVLVIMSCFAFLVRNLFEVVFNSVVLS